MGPWRGVATFVRAIHTFLLKPVGAAMTDDYFCSLVFCFRVPCNCTTECCHESNKQVQFVLLLVATTIQRRF